ncbi:MAG: dimethylsulfoniopropionate demethylase [Pseudomonadota bacterium]
MSRRIRRTPYTDRVEEAGVRGFTVVNHMLLPKAYQASVEEDYWHLKEYVQVWDVSCQRQVEIIGPDAARLVQWMTPRDISRAKVGQCLYVPLTDERGGLVNDPVLLKLAEDRFWLSIADSDVLLYAKGLAIGAGFAVEISEPDVAPLAVQGPKAEDLLASLFGEGIRNIGFFRFAYFGFLGTQQLIARSGYSRQGGFEIYLNDNKLGSALWDAVWQAGSSLNIRPGCPNLIERIEGGLFSYGNDMTRENTPLEIGLAKYCALDGQVEFIGKESLRRIASQGIARKIRGILFGHEAGPTCSKPWPVMAGNRQVGAVTSAMWSPRLKGNVGLSMIDRGYWGSGQAVTVESSDGKRHAGTISNLPFV